MAFNNFLEEINYLLQQPIPPDNEQQEEREFQQQLISMNPLALSQMYEQYKTQMREIAKTDITAKWNQSIYLMHRCNDKNVQNYVKELFIKDGFIVTPAGGCLLPLGITVHIKMDK